jgi:hypothetical protein
VAVVRRPHPVYWVIAACLVVITAKLVLAPGGPSLDAAAWAQVTSGAGARGVFALSGQLTKNTYGVYIVDTDAMTLWMYEYVPQKGCLRLAASRTWRYDRYLEDFNGCDLPPAAIEKMVEEQRQYRLESSGAAMPTPPSETGSD